MPEITNGNIKQVSELIVRDLNLESEKSIVEIKHLDELKEKLEKIVAYLLDNDFERLLNAMYRLDINEEKFKLAISGLSGDSISKEITELIINREIKKLKTRVKYRGS
jgi:hypothetical protein